MDPSNQIQHTDRSPIPFWLKASVVGLIVEKIIQHTIVSLAFLFDWGGIGASVAMSPRLLLVLGVIVALCFVGMLWCIKRGSAWAMPVVIALALFDIIGEFAAQGTFGITINISFIVATILLILAIIWLRDDRRQRVPQR